MDTIGSHKRIWITIGIILVIFLILLFVVDWEALLHIFQLTNWRIVILATVVLILGYVLISVRWRYILSNKTGLIKTFNADSIGYMVTMFTPIPAPALRVATLNRISSLPLHYVSSGMIVETLLGIVLRILALITTILLTVKITESIGSIIISGLFIVLTFVGIIWLVNHAEQAVNKIGGWLKQLPFFDAERVDPILAEIQVGVKEVGSNRTLVIGMLYSIIMWALFVVFLILAWYALPVVLTPREMIILAIASLVFVPPSAPGMIGVYQGVMVSSLLLLRITDVTTLTAYSILVFTIQLLFWVIMGIWALTRTDLKLNELINRASRIVNETVQDD